MARYRSTAISSGETGWAVGIVKKPPSQTDFGRSSDAAEAADDYSGTVTVEVTALFTGGEHVTEGGSVLTWTGLIR